MLIVEIFNNGPNSNGHDDFSIPDDVKEAFNRTFEGENKSAVVADLMRKAIAERERSRRSADFVERLRRIRASGRPVTDEEIRHVRQEFRG